MWATSPPMRPRPITPSVAPDSSRPIRRSREAKRPSRTVWSARIRFRLTASARAKTCSATDRRLAWGVIKTGIPRLAATSTATLSTPTPWRAITRRDRARSIASASSEAVRRSTACTSGNADPNSTASGTTSVALRSMPRASSWIGPSTYTLCVTLVIPSGGQMLLRGVPVGILEDVYDAGPGLEARRVLRARGDLVRFARLVDSGLAVNGQVQATCDHYAPLGTVGVRRNLELLRCAEEYRLSVRAREQPPFEPRKRRVDFGHAVLHPVRKRLHEKLLSPGLRPRSRRHYTDRL